MIGGEAHVITDPRSVEVSSNIRRIENLGFVAVTCMRPTQRTWIIDPGPSSEGDFPVIHRLPDDLTPNTEQAYQHLAGAMKAVRRTPHVVTYLKDCGLPSRRDLASMTYEDVVMEQNKARFKPGAVTFFIRSIS